MSHVSDWLNVLCFIFAAIGLYAATTGVIDAGRVYLIAFIFAMLQTLALRIEIRNT